MNLTNKVDFQPDKSIHQDAALHILEVGHP